MQSARNQQREFLLRASTLLVLFLSVWWFLLQAPALLALYAGVKIPFAFLRDAAVTMEPTGEWTFRAPVQELPDNVDGRTGAARIDSVDFTVPARDLLVFTLGVPLYLAVGLSVPGPRRIRPLLVGCALEAALGILSVMVFAEVTAYNSFAQMRAATSALEHWFLDLIWNLVTGVLPYAGPLVTAVWLHPELRHRIFAAPLS